MAEQETLFGADRPEDLELGVAQRVVFRAARDLGTINRAEAGAVVHALRGKHDFDQICPWCGVDGDPVLESLRARGLIERAAEAEFRPAAAAGTVLNPRKDNQEETL